MKDLPYDQERTAQNGKAGQLDPTRDLDLRRPGRHAVIVPRRSYAQTACMGLVRLRGGQPRARAAGRMGGNPPSPRIALLQSRAPARLCRTRDFGYGAAHALAPRRAARRTSKARASARRRARRSPPGRRFHRAPRHASAHRLRTAARRSPRRRGPLQQTGCCRPVRRARRSSRCAVASAAAPVAQSRVTAIGYHAPAAARSRWSPSGGRRTRGSSADRAQALRRRRARAAYYLLGGEEPRAPRLDVGAAPGTDVYSPVDGTSSGSRRCSSTDSPSARDRHPAVGAPALVVSRHAPASRSGADRRLAVAARSRRSARSRLLARRAAGARALHAGRGKPRLVRDPPRSHARRPEDPLRRRRDRAPGRRAVRSGSRACARSSGWTSAS